MRESEKLRYNEVFAELMKEIYHMGQTRDESRTFTSACMSAAEPDDYEKVLVKERDRLKKLGPREISAAGLLIMTDNDIKIKCEEYKEQIKRLPTTRSEEELFRVRCSERLQPREYMEVLRDERDRLRAVAGRRNGSGEVVRASTAKENNRRAEAERIMKGAGI